MEWSPAHIPTTEGEQALDNLFSFYEDCIVEEDSLSLLSPLVPSSPELSVSLLVPSSPELSVSPLVPSSLELSISPLVPSSPELSVSPLVPSSLELSVSPLVPSSPVSPVFPPNLPLPPPLLLPFSSSAQSPLSHAGTSVSPLPALCGVDPPWASRSTAPSGCLDPLAPPLASDPVSPPWLVVQTPPPWLLPPLGSAWDHRPFGYTGLPRTSGYTLVGCCHAFATDLRVVCCATPLHPYGSVWLRPPSGSASVLCRSGSTSDLWHPGSSSRNRRHVSLAASEACGVVSGRRPSICALGSFSIGSVSISHPHGFVEEVNTMAPPSLDSAVDHHPG
ncbi:protocadherin-15-like [Ctenopharyngodon idella]|uniref:protocadherin-15-like n=1 Tax=Ctenopharyngodon idella TaxID=7959 RepID=UPI0022318EA0|nr:protocadherin-15-like [Ctenopharyngodon idella]